MGLKLNENEELLLPCRSCSTLCIPFSVSAGAFILICPRCDRASEVDCEYRKDGWIVRVVADGQLVAIWE